MTAIVEDSSMIFDFSDRTSADAYMVNDLAFISGLTYDIVLDGKQANGTYKLAAAGGDSFDETIDGNDAMHGGGGDDIFCFGSNWGVDTVEQLAGGKVTLWFESGSANKWNAATLTYTDGANSVTVSGVEEVTLKFGGTAPVAGAFLDVASEKIFEDRNKGMLA